MKIRVLRSTLGWTSRITYVGRGTKVYAESIFTSPKGVEYARCQGAERPDLIRRFPDMPDLRLRLYETSAVKRRTYTYSRKRG